MNHCKSCKWWGVYREGECDKIGNIPAMKNPLTMFDLRLDADDDQGLDGGLITGPEFGCVHHEPNTNEQD